MGQRPLGPAPTDPVGDIVDEIWMEAAGEDRHLPVRYIPTDNQIRTAAETVRQRHEQAVHRVEVGVNGEHRVFDPGARLTGREVSDALGRAITIARDLRKRFPVCVDLAGG